MKANSIPYDMPTVKISTASDMVLISEQLMKPLLELKSAQAKDKYGCVITKMHDCMCVISDGVIYKHITKVYPDKEE